MSSAWRRTAQRSAQTGKAELEKQGMEMDGATWCHRCLPFIDAPPLKLCDTHTSYVTHIDLRIN